MTTTVTASLDANQTTRIAAAIDYIYYAFDVDSLEKITNAQWIEGFSHTSTFDTKENLTPFSLFPCDHVLRLAEKARSSRMGLVWCHLIGRGDLE